ncbi:MAG: GNAT family N-acetyltransferase [Candidatus Liptonbacteria bacterium]|nr:GNAT family N-acetyltransferase [Parcubacteria group bacterium]MBI4086063.1 GNAT family N-acetyltransferase [Candidatus Liptonbacteria bacterium]
MNIEIKQTTESSKAYEIAKSLPEYFDESGLKSIEQDTKNNMLFGAYRDNEMIGFVAYKEINNEAIEMSWLGVLPQYQGKNYGKILVEKSLAELSQKYKVCEVKTLSNSDDYEPYKKTRAFYKSLGFIPIETISPYPGWGNNPCQIFVMFL